MLNFLKPGSYTLEKEYRDFSKRIFVFLIKKNNFPQLCILYCWPLPFGNKKPLETFWEQIFSFKKIKFIEKCDLIFIISSHNLVKIIQIEK